MAKTFVKKRRVLVRGEKPCSKCGTPKKRTEFPQQRVGTSRDGRGSVCKECKARYMREKRQGSKDGVRICAGEGCDAKLSRYNPGKVCGPCERKAA